MKKCILFSLMLLLAFTLIGSYALAGGEEGEGDKEMKPGDKIDAQNTVVRAVPLAYVDQRDVRADRVGDVEGLPVAVSLQSHLPCQN